MRENGGVSGMHTEASVKTNPPISCYGHAAQEKNDTLLPWKALYEGTWRQDRLLDGLEARGNVSKYRLNQEKGASTHSCTV